MPGINNYVQLISSDFLYLSVFLCLSYTLGNFTNLNGLKSPNFTSPTVSLPWFVTIFAFISPTLTLITRLHTLTFIVFPICILIGFAVIFAISHRKHTDGKFSIESKKLHILNPILSLITMFILRDILTLPFKSLIILAIISYFMMLVSELIREGKTISSSGVIYNSTSLLLFGTGMILIESNSDVSNMLVISAAALGLFATLLYSANKPANQSTASEDDHDLFSRFEELVSDGQFQTAVDMSEDGLWEFKLESDLMIVSRPLQLWLGLEVNSIEQAADFWIDRVHPQDWSKFPESWIPEDFSSLRKKIRALNAKSLEFEIRLKSDDQSYKWVRVRFQVANEGSHTALHGSFKDVDKEKHAHAQITQLSLYDMTTGLPNFSSLLNHLNEALSTNTRHALLFINIDNFKLINDLMGFFTGDEILGEISRRLSKILPDHAHIYRFGGDEFVILTNQPDSAESIARLITKEFDGKLHWKETHLRITCSLGISTFPETHAHDVESILKCSDIALGYAKLNGKNQYAIFNTRMMEKLEQRYNVINALEHSHMSENFEIHYQPLKHRNKSDVVHVEALLRWTWNDKAIPPSEFIPIAEETGLIIPIGKMVLDQVCRDIAYMQAIDLDLRTSVNVSAVQLLHPAFIKSVMQAIEAHCINPNQLTIEITETSLLHNIDSVVETLEELRRLGLRISLDDFGTGFSSLSHIIDLPIDELKLDRSFIQNFHTDVKRQNVIRNVIQLAHSIGLSVVAEGVEIEPEFKLLKNYGCDIYQGYYFAHPTPLSILIQEQEQTA